MKSVLQNFRTGEFSVADVPPPTLQAEQLLVRNVASLVSAGTEKSIIELAKMNPLQKARSRPDLVKKVLDKAGQEGLIGTAKVVLNLVSKPVPLGYSCAGIVAGVGERLAGFRTGDRVACAGLGYANHAEVVTVPRNLVVRVPDEVTFDEAAFVTVGAIALHSVRQAQVNVGERVAVIGLGLVGQLITQICLASGCRVFGTDLNPSRVALAVEAGAESSIADPERFAKEVAMATDGEGADAVIISAATDSSGPIELAAKLARDRARVVAVGDIGLEVPRREYYEKELELLQSRSYGPGRYDPNYEEKGFDYPIGYVRWTENRNMSAFLRLIARGKLNMHSLISHRFNIEEAAQAYELLQSDEPFIGILLEYDHEREQPQRIDLRGSEWLAPAARNRTVVRVGVVGAGQFAQGVLLPNMDKISGCEIVAVATGSGLTARSVAEKYGAVFCTSDYHEVVDNENVDAVVIATRHDLHSEIVTACLTAGKDVFVEKPLAITQGGLRSVIEALAGPAGSSEPRPGLLVGYNRRFSPMASQLKKAMGRGPFIIRYGVNAGVIPASNWVQDPEIGGGRIVGEVCHFIDLMQYVTNALPSRVYARAIEETTVRRGDPDNLIVQIDFDDGSLGTITYASNGDSAYPKEQLEVFASTGVARIDNWRELQVYQGGKRVLRKRAFFTAEKGHREEMRSFVSACADGNWPVPVASLLATTRTTFAIQASLGTGAPVKVDASV